MLSSLNIRFVYRPLIEPCMVAHFGTIFFAEPLISLGDHCAPRGHLVTTIYTWGLHSPAFQGEGGIYQQRELKKGNNERWAKVCKKKRETTKDTGENGGEEKSGLLEKKTP